MKSSWLRVTMLFMVFVLASAADLTAQDNLRRIYLSVRDETGAPIPDLRRGEVQVTENAQTQAIGAVSLAADPLRIALLIDTTDRTRFEVQDLREGVRSFINAVPMPHEMMIVTTGQTVRVRVPPTVDRKKLIDSASSLFIEGHGGGTLLFDALDEIDRRFMKVADGRTPVFVIVTSDEKESSQRFQENAFNRLSDSLAMRTVPVHAVVVSRGALQLPGAIAQHLTDVTGGRLTFIGASRNLVFELASTAVEIAKNAEEMSTWYYLDYVSTSDIRQPTIRVTVSRPGARTSVSLTRTVKRE